MRLGVISDTHGHLAFATEAKRLLKNLAIDALIHCGDIGSPEIIHLFADWPAHFVVGNTDWETQALEEAARAAGATYHGEFGELEQDGQRIAFLHSHDGQRFRETIHSGKYDLVCYGHTHQAESHRVGNTLVLNPGALYRANPKGFATVDLPVLAVTHHTLP